MGTRRRDAERRQVSLAVEPLEERFLLSASLSVPFPVSDPAHEARSAFSQVILGHTSSWQADGAAPNPSIDYQHDGDGDFDLPDATDRGKPDSGLLTYPLFCSTGNHVEGCLYLTPPTRTPESMALPAANPTPFLPLLSATGLGTTSLVPVSALAEANSDNESLPANLAPSRGPGQTRPIPTVPDEPQTTKPPAVAEMADPPSTSSEAPFIELLPIDPEAIQRGIDTFCQHLSDLSEEWCDGQLMEKLAPWLLVASVAGYGWIRFRNREDRRFTDLCCDRPESVPSNFLPGGNG